MVQGASGVANRLMYLQYRLTPGDAEFTLYRQMQELSVESAERYLDGPWELEILTGDHSRRPFSEAFSEMYREMFARLRELWSQGDNVLFLDPDVLFLKPTQIFGRFQEFRMFWATDPEQRRHFDPYLNGGIFYLPTTMDARQWRFADAAVRKMREWNDSQDILNEMFWTQQPVPELHPELNWSPNVQSIIPMEDAHLIHFNSTRGAASVLEVMRKMRRE